MTNDMQIYISVTLHLSFDEIILTPRFMILIFCENVWNMCRLRKHSGKYQLQKIISVYAGCEDQVGMSYYYKAFP